MIIFCQTFFTVLLYNELNSDRSIKPNNYLEVMYVKEYESEIRFYKSNMADPIWRLKIKKSIAFV